jgi:hypothetical protein
MGMLLMLMTVGGSIIAFLLLVFSLLTRKIWLRNFILGGITVWFAFYFVMLFGVSFLSEEKTLGFNEPKAFCGFYFDCHMHTAVSGLRKTKTIGGTEANGEFYVVKVKVLSDAKRAELNLYAPKFEVVNENGERYEPVKKLTPPGDDFERKVPAGGDFESEVVFDLPVDVKNLRLDVSEGIGIDKVIESILIGDEDSIFHKRRYFKLESEQIASR